MVFHAKLYLETVLNIILALVYDSLFVTDSLFS